MKKLLLAFLWLTLCHHLFSQNSGHELQDSLVARFNRSDFRGFYDLGSSDWKQRNRPDGIIGWLGYIKEQTGNINSSILHIDSGKTQYYAWDGQKKMLDFALKNAGDNRFEGFDFKRGGLRTKLRAIAGKIHHRADANEQHPCSE
jgi:hypothetical protein